MNKKFECCKHAGKIPVYKSSQTNKYYCDGCFNSLMILGKANPMDIFNV